MKTEYIRKINKPILISIHNLDEGYYRGYQWSGDITECLKNTTCIGVWHIKYKKLDCNFS